MLACVDAGNVKKAETPTSPIPTAPETAANIFVKRVMCASLSTGRVPSGVIVTRSQPAEQRCALVHAAWFSAFTFRVTGSRLTEVRGPPEEARESPSLSSLRLLARPDQDTISTLAREPVLFLCPALRHPITR